MTELNEIEKNFNWHTACVTCECNTSLICFYIFRFNVKENTQTHNDIFYMRQIDGIEPNVTTRIKSII